MKRVRKAKADGTDSTVSSDDSQNGESLPGRHSVLEISGPTIPSPGPSGMLHVCILLTQTSVKTEYKHRVGGFDLIERVVFEQVAGGTTQVLAGQGQRSANGHEG